MFGQLGRLVRGRPRRPSAFPDYNPEHEQRQTVHFNKKKSGLSVENHGAVSTEWPRVLLTTDVRDDYIWRGV